MKDKKLNDKVVKSRPVQLIHVDSLTKARRLFSRVIDSIQVKDYDEKQVRLLIYALSGFVSIYKESEFENRILVVEKLLREKGKNDNI